MVVVVIRGALKRPQALGRDGSLELGDAADSGNIEAGGDIGERIQNPVALHYPGMGERQHRIDTRLAAVHENVEIDEARAPALVFFRAAERAFDVFRFLEQRERVELRDEAGGGVDEIALFYRAERFRAVQLREGDEARGRERAEFFDGVQDLSARVVEVAAQANVGGLPDRARNGERRAAASEANR